MLMWTGSGAPGASGTEARVPPGRVDCVGAEGASEALSGEIAGIEQDGADKESEPDKRREVVCIADAAQGQVYVCFEGPLGVT